VPSSKANVEKLKDQLLEISGEKNVLTSEELMEPYSHDESAVPKAMPDLVVKAGSTEEVSRIVKACAALDIPVVPRGLGTGLTGGAVPTFGGVVISTERMNQVKEIDEVNMMAVAEPGIITGDFHRAVQAKGLMYPPDPASLDSCSLGGNLAENAGGPHTLKYGLTRNYVTGIEAVLPSGDIIRYGGKVLKNTTGYDIPQMLMGSEGTLGIFTEITTKLIPLPPTTIDLLVPFSNFQSAAEAVTEIMRAKKILPAVVEFMDLAAVLCAKRALGKELPFKPSEAQLLIQLDGHDQASVEAQAEAIGEICLEKGADDVLAATNAADKERLWQARRIVLEAAKSEGTKTELQDVVVPRSNIPELLVGAREICEKAGIPMMTVGHAGDGNVHFVLYNKGVPDDKWEMLFGGLMKDILMLALRLNGAISGEHGIGTYKLQYLDYALGNAEREMMRRVKQAWDPRNIMNPGKAI
jgi:glycolate oxidase